MRNGQPKAALRAVKGLLEGDNIEDALSALVALCSRGLPDNLVMSVARVAGKTLARLPEQNSLQLKILAQCNLDFLMPELQVRALGAGIPVNVTSAPYDNVLQSAHAAGVESSGGIWILMPWSARLFNGSQSPERRIAEELDYWRRVWSLAEGRKILMVGYDWVGPGPLGHFGSVSSQGHIRLVSEINTELVKSLPKGAFFLDLSVVSGLMGRHQFYDARNYHWTKQPFSTNGLRFFAEHLTAGVRALSSGPKKVVVLDLDNTLWGGVVGETGPMGICLDGSPDGEAFQAFQSYLQGLSERGVLLVVCSKNERANAEEPFVKNPAMILRLESFADFQANWEPKSKNIQQIAENLNLGLDSFVFVDDSLREREEVRCALPQVEIIDLPDNPADYVSALERSLFFETPFLTEDDSLRAQAYAVEARRREGKQGAGSLEDYLRGLDMVATVSEVSETNLTRIVQLLGKTNQFNFTTRRHSVERVQEFAATPGAFVRCLSLRDNFGDLGIVSVMIAVPEQRNGATGLLIESWLMSCRVFQRTVEYFLFSELLDHARVNGFSTLWGEHIPTAKNVILNDLYPRLGFALEQELSDGTRLYTRSSECPLEVEHFIRSEG